MKKCWVEPRIRVQKFMPNEYVAACVTGTIECAVPGKNPYACDGGNPTRFFDYRMDSNRWDGSTISPDGLEHGLCGNTATISANVNHFFTLLGKMFFTPYGKEFFTYLGKQIFTS